MAEIEGKKISGVPERTELTGNELYPFADSGSQGHVKGSVLKGYCATPIGEAEGTAFDGARGKAVEDVIGRLYTGYNDSYVANAGTSGGIIKFINDNPDYVSVRVNSVNLNEDIPNSYEHHSIIDHATSTNAGVMSANDKKNLDNVAGLYYIPYSANDEEWTQKIKDMADNGPTMFLEHIDSGPMTGVAFKANDNYAYAEASIMPEYILSSSEENRNDIFISTYSSTNIDNPENYFEAHILLRTGGDGSKFLGDDGEYHSVSEGLTVPMTVNLQKYISGGIISDLDALDVELTKLRQLGGFVYWNDELWHCTIGGYDSGVPTAYDVPTASIFAQLNLFKLYTGDANRYDGTYRIESAPTLRYITVLILSDGSIVETDFNSERMVLNNIVCTSAEDILSSGDGYVSTIDTVDYELICHEFVTGHILRIGNKFFYPVLDQGSGNSILPIFIYNAGNDIESIRFSWNEEASNFSVIHESLSLSDTYATKQALSTKQDALVSGTNIKTVNGQSILGEGDITIEVPEGGITDAPSDGSTYGRNNGAWIKVEMPDVSEFITETEADGKYATPALVDSKVAALVNSAPATLDTLKELADALGNDANFSTTITSKLGEKVDKTTYESDKAGFATKTELANKLDTSTYNSDKDGFATKTELNNKKNITIVQEVIDASSSASFNLDPNTLKKMGEVETITVLGFTTTGLQPNELAEYAFEFKSGDTPTVLTMPESVKWIGDHTIEANKTYQVSIVNNLAVMGGA